MDKERVHSFFRIIYINKNQIERVEAYFKPYILRQENDNVEGYYSVVYEVECLYSDWERFTYEVIPSSIYVTEELLKKGLVDLVSNFTLHQIEFHIIYSELKRFE